VLKEGRNREIRRILARIGHKVVQLKRIAIGPLRLGEMPLGAYRELTASEVQALRKSAAPARGGAEPAKKTGVPIVRVARGALDRGTTRSPGGRRDGGERAGSGKGTSRPDSRGGVRPRDGQRPAGRASGRPRPDTRSASGEARAGRGRGSAGELPVRRPRVATVIAGDFQESQAPPMETGADEGRSRSPRRVMVKPSGRESSRGRTGQRTGREQGGRGRSDQDARGSRTQGERRPQGERRTQGERRPQGERTPGGRGQGTGGQGSRRPAGGGQGSGGRRPVIRRQRTRRSSE
jgi:23S rRNA pseudouridine2605 synthase